MKCAYIGLIRKDASNGYRVVFPDFPCCVACGEDLSELLQHASEALDSTIASMVKHADALPRPSTCEQIKELTDGLGDDVMCTLAVAVYPPSPIKRFNVTASGNKLARITAYAKRNHISRSELMIMATLEYMSTHP